MLTDRTSYRLVVAESPTVHVYIMTIVTAILFEKGKIFTAIDYRNFPLVVSDLS